MNHNQSAINQIIEHGIDNIGNGWDGKEAGDLHHYLYNEDYFIIGTYDAKLFLDEYGTWDAIQAIQDYEKMNFGEVSTDLSDPEKVANMLAYIVGEEVLNKCKTLGRVWYKKLTTRNLEAIKKELQAQIKGE